MSEQNKVRSKRVRSPSYPAFSLPKALKKIEDYYRAEGRNEAFLSVALSHWGYKETSGSGLKAVAALSSFGLVDVTGKGTNRKVKLSELALRIVLDKREVSADREQSIRSAALKPKIHQKLWNYWKSDLPSPGNMRHHLIFDEKFNENFVDDFIKEYVETIKFAKLTEDSLTPSEEETESESQEIQEDLEHEDTHKHTVMPAGLLQKKKANSKKVNVHDGQEIAKFPVGNNCTISLVADGPYGKKSIEALVAQLKLNLELGVFDDVTETDEL